MPVIDAGIILVCTADEGHGGVDVFALDDSEVVGFVTTGQEVETAGTPENHEHEDGDYVMVPIKSRVAIQLEDFANVDAERIVAGTVLICTADFEDTETGELGAEIYDHVRSDTVIAFVSHGEHVVAAGAPKNVDGVIMVETRPDGAVQVDCFRACKIDIGTALVCTAQDVDASQDSHSVISSESDAKLPRVKVFASAHSDVSVGFVEQGEEVEVVDLPPENVDGHTMVMVHRYALAQLNQFAVSDAPGKFIQSGTRLVCKAAEGGGTRLMGADSKEVGFVAKGKEVEVCGSPERNKGVFRVPVKTTGIVQLEFFETTNVADVVEGTVLVCTAEDGAEIHVSLHTGGAIESVSQGEHVVAAGIPKYARGVRMVEVEPYGAVHLDLFRSYNLDVGSVLVCTK